MNFIKRAGVYCVRQHIRMTILLFIWILMITSILVSIAVRDATKEATAHVQTAIGGKIQLELDTDQHMGNGQQNQWGTVYGYNGDLITPEIVDAISRVEGVVDYNSEDEGGYYGAGVDFQYLPASFALNYTEYGEASGYTATISSEKCSQFQSGEYRLVEGRHIMPDDRHVCLLSKELADYNKLSVGDRVKMYSLDVDKITQFEVVGIFDGTEGTSGNALTVDEIPANCGYIDYSTLFELWGEKLNGYQQLTIYVEDPVSIENVYDRIAALQVLKDKTLKLSMDTEQYESVASPLKSLHRVVNVIIIIIVIVGAIILMLLLTVWIKGRNHEMGILLSIGISKMNIILQILTETLFVTILAYMVAVPLSIFVADKAGVLFMYNITKETAEVNLHIDVTYLPLVCVIGILLIAIVVLVSSWTVICSEPKDILTKID